MESIPWLRTYGEQTATRGEGLRGGVEGFGYRGNRELNEKENRV